MTQNIPETEVYTTATPTKKRWNMMEHDGTAVLQQAPVVNLFFPPSHSGMNSSNKYEENKETRLHCWTWLPGIAELCPSVELRRLGRSHSHLHHHDSFLVFLDSLFFYLLHPFASREWLCHHLHASIRKTNNIYI